MLMNRDFNEREDFLKIFYGEIKKKKFDLNCIAGRVLGCSIEDLMKTEVLINSSKNKDMLYVAKQGNMKLNYQYKNPTYS